MTNRFIQESWATTQPLDYFLQVEMRGAMFSVSWCLSWSMWLWKKHGALDFGQTLVLLSVAWLTGGS